MLAVLLPSSAAPGPVAAQSQVRVTSGLTPDGGATPLWLAVLRARRAPDSAHRAAAEPGHPLEAGEAAWAAMIESRGPAWAAGTGAVAAPYRPVPGPDTVLVVLGNRGASDAFTHDERTVGFDLSALQREYGDAGKPGNQDLIDRLFRHEYAHVMQRAWLRAHPYPANTELRLALVEIWKEGLGNYLSMSDRWRAPGPAHSETAARALAVLEPRFVARLAAIACATPERAAALKADLSWGRFDRKWGAITPALWLEAEPGTGDEALAALVRAGPDGVLDLAERHLAAPLAPAARELRQAERLCIR